MLQQVIRRLLHRQGFESDANTQTLIQGRQLRAAQGHKERRLRDQHDIEGPAMP